MIKKYIYIVLFVFLITGCVDNSYIKKQDIDLNKKESIVVLSGKYKMLLYQDYLNLQKMNNYILNNKSDNILLYAKLLPLDENNKLNIEYSTRDNKTYVSLNKGDNIELTITYPYQKVTKEKYLSYSELNIYSIKTGKKLVTYEPDNIIKYYYDNEKIAAVTKILSDGSEAAICFSKEDSTKKAKCNEVRKDRIFKEGINELGKIAKDIVKNGYTKKEASSLFLPLNEMLNNKYTY